MTVGGPYITIPGDRSTQGRPGLIATKGPLP